MRSSVDTACSGSSEEIKIGAGVLDYISELGNIQTKILEAYTYSEQCVQNIESEDTYQGEAREEMLAFFKSLASNMQKMTFCIRRQERTFKMLIILCIIMNSRLWNGSLDKLEEMNKSYGRRNKKSIHGLE